MEKKPSISKNLLVIVILVLMIAVVAVVAATQKRELNPTLGPLSADATQAPVETEVPAETGIPAQSESPAATDVPAAEAAVEPAKAYLLVTVAGAMYEPIPLYEEGRYTVTRGDLVNVIEVTPESVRMYESSCDNQDCVEQGVVSLENRSDRVLQNMIICLPNEVVLELYTKDEVAQLLLSMLENAGENAAEGAADE